MWRINKTYLPWGVGTILLLVLTALNWRPNFLPAGDQAFLEFMAAEKHLGLWSGVISGYVSNQIYIFSELVYYLNSVFATPFSKYLTLLLFIVGTSYAILFRIFKQLTNGDYLAASLAPLLFFIPRFAMGGEFWGITDITSVQGRSFYMPILFLLYYAAALFFTTQKNSRYLFWLGVGAGISFMVYPGGGFYLPLILGISFCIYWLRKKMHFIHVVVYTVGYLVGMLPTWINYSFNQNARLGGILQTYFSDSGFNVSEFNFLAVTRFAHIFGKGWTRMTADVLAILILLGIAYWYGKRKTDSAISKTDAWPLRAPMFTEFHITFAAATIFITAAIPIVQSALVHGLGWPYFFFEQLRCSRYLYVPLLFLLVSAIASLYQRHLYRQTLFLAICCLFSFRFFYPVINTVLYYALPEDLRLRTGLAETLYGDDEKALRQFIPLNEAAVFAARTVGPKEKIYVVSDDDINLNFRRFSERLTNTMGKELSLYIVQRPAEAVAVSERIRVYADLQKGEATFFVQRMRQDGFAYALVDVSHAEQWTEIPGKIFDNGVFMLFYF